MTKTKRSFFEKLTGSKKIENEETLDEMESMDIFSEDEETEIDIPDEENEIADDWSNKNDNEEVKEMEDDNDGEGQLTIDVYQTPDDIIIKSTIAGVKPEDLDVSINNDMVTIKGERKQEEEISQDDYYYQECYWGAFSRSVVLPTDVLVDKVEASLKNGILTIKLPKAAKDQTKKIQVRGF